MVLLLTTPHPGILSGRADATAVTNAGRVVGLSARPGCVAAGTAAAFVHAGLRLPDVGVGVVLVRRLWQGSCVGSDPIQTLSLRLFLTDPGASFAFICAGRCQEMLAKISRSVPGPFCSRLFPPFPLSSQSNLVSSLACMSRNVPAQLQPEPVLKKKHVKVQRWGSKVMVFREFEV